MDQLVVFNIDKFTLYQMAQSIILEPNGISIRSGYGIYTRIFMGNLVIDLMKQCIP